jgi:hypothetical protein
MTDIKTDLGRDALEHFGVLGMKWGHRKEDPSSGKTGRKADKAWKRDGVKPLDGYIQTVLASKAFREKAASINASMPGKTLGDRDYRNAHRQLLQDLADYVGPQYRSPSGDQYWDLTATLSPNGNFSFMGKPKPVTSGMGEPTDKPFSVSHSNTQEAVVLCSGKAIVNESGQVVDYGDLKLENSELMMSSSDTEDFLAHYGVLGMRWGHRKDKESHMDKTIRKRRESSKGHQRIESAGTGLKPSNGVRSNLASRGVIRKKDIPRLRKAMTDALNQDLPKINRRKEFRNMSTASRATKIKYRRAVAKSLQNTVNANRRSFQLKDIPRLTMSGLTYGSALGFWLYPDPVLIGFKDAKARGVFQHSSDTNAVKGVYCECVEDENGYIIGINVDVTPKTSNKGGDMAQSDLDEKVSNFLAHYGVLGMRWGYRKDELAIAKADAKFERKAVTKGLSRRKYVRAVNRAIKGFNKDIHDINKSPTFRNKDLTNKNDPVTRQYFELVQKTFEDHLAAASRKLPTNYSGTRQFRLNPSFDNRWPTVSVVDISASPADVDAQHSSVSDSNDTAPPAPMPLKAIFDQLGKVVRIEEMVEEPIVMHSEEVGQEFIEHFGVLGMRWGYRKADNILAPKPEAPKEPKKLGPIQKHELNQLSNDEVKQVIERINLEKQLREVMTEPAKPKGQSWIQQNAGPLATKAAITAATTATSLAIKWYFDGKKDKAKAATKAAEKAREIILTTQAEIDAKAMRDAAKAARKAAKAASQATVII